MATEAEGTFEVGGAKLYTKTWTPVGPIKAKLVLIHGFSDHVGPFNELANVVASRGIQIFGFDQRGWGRSVTKPSEKGLTGPTTQVIAEVAAFIQSKLPSPEPVFVLGNSMGGGEIITLAGDAQYEALVKQVRGWLLEAPFIAFAPEETPSSLLIFAGRLAGRVFPHQQMVRKLEPKILTRDPAAAQRIEEDPLVHNTGTLEGLAGLLDRTAALTAGEVKLGAAVNALWLGHGDADKVCDYKSAVNYVENQPVKDKTIKTYEGGYHALHADLCWQELAKDIGDWILARSEERPAEAKL